LDAGVGDNGCTTNGGKGGILETEKGSGEYRSPGQKTIRIKEIDCKRVDEGLKAWGEVHSEREKGFCPVKEARSGWEVRWGGRSASVSPKKPAMDTFG